MTMARMTVAKLAVVVSGLEARVAALSKAVEKKTEGTKPLPEETAEQPVIIRHTSRAVLSVDPAVPDLGGMAQQFAHYRLPAGVKRGEVRIARITGQGTRGRGYANLRVELNGDEGWGDGEKGALWLVVLNAPFDRGGKPDTWGLGS
jgi:hypothetical protein